MGLLSRSIFREVLAGAGLGTLLFSFVLFLQRISLLFEQLVRGAASTATVGYLFVLVMPFTLMMTLPVGVLVGVLIGLSRMSSDGEIIAMRAAGVPGRRVLAPVLVFAAIGSLLTAACSLYLTPYSIRETVRILNRIVADQMTAEIQPRVFAEQFPNKTIYIGDVISGPVTRWRNVFIADMTPPEQRKRSTQEAAADAPRITIATGAVAVADSANNRISLRLNNGSSHEVGKEGGQYFNTAFPLMDQSLEAQKPAEKQARAYSDMETGPLLAEARRSREADIELQRRLSLPPACLLLALVGIPLGVSSRKAGKSAAFVLTVFLAFLYFMAQVSLLGLAKQGTLSPAVAAWTPNALFALVGLFLLIRLETPGDQDLIGAIRGRFLETFSGWAERYRSKRERLARCGPRVSIRLLPQLIDTYVLSEFLFYFFICLVSFVVLTQVFTFFELLSDIIRNQIPMAKVFRYHLFLGPKFIYDYSPVAALVAVLITFSIMANQNEVTAFKASGVSLYRLSAPVLIAGILLSSALFAFDHYVVPDANLIQDGIRAEIKGKAPQTYLRPDRKWIFGHNSRIFYYKYFDPAEKVMVGVHVYELDPGSFRLTRHIAAERAHWQPNVGAWVFQNGWVRDMQDIRIKRYEEYQVRTFAELDEQPDYFLIEEKQYKQMNFQQLDHYIQDLKQSGFDTIRLQVQFHRKFSVPLFAFILAVIAVPFSFLGGRRGAMASVGASFGIAIAYRACDELFVQVGNLNQLPAPVAAWSPDAIFLLAGLYMMTRMRS
jgi:LPS export ABC transporter permease LptG/LPS export ABC transporter permease LptF